MQGEAEAHGRLVGGGADPIEHDHGVGGGGSRPQGLEGDALAVLGAGHREHRQHAVAHEFQDLAAGLGHRTTHDVEIIVEQRGDGVARQGVRRAREAAQVAVPDDRLDRLSAAALDLTGQDALSGGATDIGIEEVGRGVADRVGLDDPREGELQEVHAVEIVAGEAARFV
jgi:hypothetical protein